MGRIFNSNSIALPAPFQAGSSDPIDARIIVENFSDLLTPSVFGTILNGEVCLIYEGITVYVRADKASYTYMGPMGANGVLSTEVLKKANWVKTADIANPSDKTITVSSDDKVITIEGDEISVTLELKWDSESKKLQLIGKNNQVVHEIDASDFVIDGMLDNVTLDNNTLKFTFNTDSGKSEIPVSLTDFLVPDELTRKDQNTLIKNNGAIVPELTLTNVGSSDSMKLYTKDLVDKKLSWYEA